MHARRAKRQPQPQRAARRAAPTSRCRRPTTAMPGSGTHSQHTARNSGWRSTRRRCVPGRRHARAIQALAPVRAMTLWCSANDGEQRRCQERGATAKAVGPVRRGLAEGECRRPRRTSASETTNRTAAEPREAATDAITGSRGAYHQGHGFMGSWTRSPGLRPLSSRASASSSAFGAGREAFWEADRAGRSGTRAITEFDVSTLSLPRRRAGAARGHRRRDAARRRAGTASSIPRRPEALLAGGAVRRGRGARGLERRRASRSGEPSAGVIIGSGGGGIDVGEQQYRDFFTTGGQHVTPYAIALGICGMVSSEISIALGLRGISHVLSTGCTSSTDAHRLRRGAAAGRRGRRAAVGRHRRLRDARHDLRLLAHARGLHALQRPAGRGVAAVRPGPRRLRARARARGCWRSSARTARARAARASTRPSTATRRRATRTTACRWIPTASEIVRCMRTALERSGRAARGDRLRQLSRHVDPAERRHRVAVHARRARRASPTACRGRRPSR